MARDGALDLDSLRLRADDVGLSVKMVSGMVGGVAEAIGQTASTFAEYERHVGEVGRVSEDLRAQLDALGGMVRTMERMVALVDHVALQTRVLSFNATLEAARLGEHGRGFAVVADSVKQLARQTTEATGEMRDALERITRAAVRATEDGGLLGAAVAEVRELTRAFVGMMDEQAQTSRAAVTYVDRAADEAEAIARELEAGAASPQGPGEDALSAAENGSSWAG